MHMKKTLILTLSALMLTLPPVMAEEEHHPKEAEARAASTSSTDESRGMEGRTTQDGDSSGQMMGRGGGMGMMNKGMHGGGRGSGMSMMGKGMHGGMHKKHRRLMGRIDVLEARMIKMEAMLERLLLR